MNKFYIDYIKALENPDRIGWNGKVWSAPTLKGYDSNQRGYGIDINKNLAARELTKDRPGKWLTEEEADKLMRDHILYVYNAALKHIKGFDTLSDKRKAALLGMLYRGDSVNANKNIININEPDDNKFFESISNYYKSKGLNERAKNSSNFFNQLTNFLIPMKWEQWKPSMKFKDGGRVRKMLTAAGGPIYEEDLSDKLEPYAAGIGLAGDAVGLGAAATGIGIPVGTAIAGFANIPNLIIDGYQTARDTWRSFNDNGNSLGSAAWNGGEFILDAAGLKALQYINKATKAGVASKKYLTSTEKALDSKPWKRVGTGHGRVSARQSANHKRKYNSSRNKALEESNIELAKRGVRPALGLYYQQKLTDEMAKRGYGVAVNDAIRSANRTIRLNLGTISGVSGGTNIYHLLPKRKNGGLIRKMQTAAGGPIYWLRKRLYNNIEPFGYNDIGSRLINAIVLNKNEHNNFKGDYSDTEKAPAQYLTIDNIWGEYLHIPENERKYSNGKYKIKNNGNGTFSLPFESMEDIMQSVNSNNPLLWGLRGKLGNSVVGEYDVHRGYDKNGDYLKYIDHWRINPYDVKDGKDYGLDNNSLLKWYFKGKDDVSFGLGTPVEIQGKYYLDDIYGVKGKDRGGRYLPEVVITGNKKKQGGKMNILEFLKKGSGIHIKKENKGKFTSYCGGKVTSECIAKGKASSNPAIRKRATFAANARKWKHKNGGVIKAQEGTKMNWGELAKIVGGIASNAMSTASENKKLNAWAKQYKLEKVNALDYITKYLLEILENNLKSQQAARALGSTVNFNPDIDKHFAYLLANQEVARKNNEIDKQNKLLDVQTENLKTSNWMNLFGNIALTGLGYLTSNIGKKSTNVPPSSTSTTANTATTSNFNNYMNNITIQKQLGIV